MATEGNPFFKLNRDQFASLAALVKDDVDAAGRAIAAAAQENVPDDVEVTATESTDVNGRPTMLVTIAHPSGLGRQAKNGVLTRAAASQGLEVTRYIKE